MTETKLTYQPLTPKQWNDFETLFGSNGACGGCWCMHWRLKTSVFDKQKGDANRLAMKAIVDSGRVPGLLFYNGNRPVGWCALAPREEYDLLSRSKVLAPVDNQPAWAVVCFFLHKEYRKRGLSVQLLQSAAEYAKSQGALVLEGFPYATEKKLPDPFVFTGLLSAFQKAGFVEVSQRSKVHPIYRLMLEQPHLYIFNKL